MQGWPVKDTGLLLQCFLFFFFFPFHSLTEIHNSWKWGGTVGVMCSSCSEHHKWKELHSQICPLWTLDGVRRPLPHRLWPESPERSRDDTCEMSPFPPGGSHRTAVGNECLDYWFLMHLASNRKQLHYLANCAPTLNIVSRITRRAAVLFITCGGVDLISQIKTECANLTVGVSPWLSIWVRKWQELGVKCDWNT